MYPKVLICDKSHIHFISFFTTNRNHILVCYHQNIKNTAIEMEISYGDNFKNGRSYKEI